MGDPDPKGSGRPVVEIGVGELGLGLAPEVLMTPALGSCVGVGIWDPVKHRGGLAHVMLPEPGEAYEGSPDRFASYAVPFIVERLRKSGSLRTRLVAKVAGGAAMFAADTMLSQIGRRNVDEVKRQLALLSVPLIAEDTGGSHARTVELRLDTGLMLVRSYQFGIKEL